MTQVFLQGATKLIRGANALRRQNGVNSDGTVVGEAGRRLTAGRPRPRCEHGLARRESHPEDVDPTRRNAVAFPGRAIRNRGLQPSGNSRIAISLTRQRNPPSLHSRLVCSMQRRKIPKRPMGVTKGSEKISKRSDGHCREVSVPWRPLALIKLTGLTSLGRAQQHWSTPPATSSRITLMLFSRFRPGIYALVWVIACPTLPSAFAQQPAATGIQKIDHVVFIVKEIGNSTTCSEHTYEIWDKNVRSLPPGKQSR